MCVCVYESFSVTYIHVLDICMCVCVCVCVCGCAGVVSCLKIEPHFLTEDFASSL